MVLGTTMHWFLLQPMFNTSFSDYWHSSMITHIIYHKQLSVPVKKKVLKTSLGNTNAGR